ncbi:MAG: glycoside hydrolase family 5 protein [Armatimonadota bacterium]
MSGFAGDMAAFSQNQRLGRGVNIFGYDPAWSGRGKRRMQPEHFRLLKEAGFSHVRIPLHPFEHMAEGGEGYRLEPGWLATLDWALEQAGSNHLMAILDCHEYNSMARDPEGLKPKWLAFWEQLAPRYADAPDTVLFELLNEPNRALTAEKWNSFLPEALAIVRESNQRRTVVIGPGEWNSIGKLDELVLPEADRNIVVTVHYYEPFGFTHQGAPWEEPQLEVGRSWPASDAEPAAIERDFLSAQRWAERNRRPILLGEFGAYDRADMDSRARWTAFVAREAESRNWSWSYWQFDDDFVLYDIDGGDWIEPIRDALIPPAV